MSSEQATGTGPDGAGRANGVLQGRRRWLVGAGLAAAALGGAVALASSGGSAASPRPGTGSSGDGAGTVDLGRTSQVAAIRPFAGCPELLAYYRKHAARLVGAYGLPGAYFGGPANAESARTMGGDTAAAPAAGAATQLGTTSQTGTNVQVAGVDEADVAKLADDLLLSLVDGSTLRIARVDGARVRRVAALTLSTAGAPDTPVSSDQNSAPAGRPAPDAPTGWSPRQLLVDGDTVLVIGDVYGLDPAATGAAEDSGAGRAMFAPVGRPRVRLAEVDISDPASPRLVRTLDVDGGLVGARMVDGVARLAVTTSPRLTWRAPEPRADGSLGGGAEQKARERNRAIARKAPVQDWLPGYTLTDYAGGRATGTDDGQLLACADVATPTRFSGIDTLSLLNLDLRDGGLRRPVATAVAASGSTLYATAGSTYVATSPWQDWTALAESSTPGISGGADIRAVIQSQRTAVHQFATPGRTAARYVASGEVPGFLLGQFALDEHDGVLRVASTTQPPFSVLPAEGDGATRQSVSRVSVLRRDGGKLATIGTVGGLGKGETIRAVRFLGPVGYVVTFRQTDPLYTLDLHEPTRPRVAGELKVLGYSAYLHPAGEGRLVGIGQDADTDGRAKGMQVSLFDVTDPARPRRLDAVRITGAWSDVEADHHAFTMADGLALAPYQAWRQLDETSPTSQTSWDAGLLAVRVRDDALGSVRRLRGLTDGPVVFNKLDGSSPEEALFTSAPMRTFVRDGVIYSLSQAGVAVHDANSLDRLGFTRWITTTR